MPYHRLPALAAEIARIRALFTAQDSIEYKTDTYARQLASGDLSEYTTSQILGHLLTRMDSVEASLVELFKERI